MITIVEHRAYHAVWKPQGPITPCSSFAAVRVEPHPIKPTLLQKRDETDTSLLLTPVFVQAPDREGIDWAGGKRLIDMDEERRVHTGHVIKLGPSPNDDAGLEPLTYVPTDIRADVLTLQPLALRLHQAISRTSALTPTRGCKRLYGKITPEDQNILQLAAVYPTLQAKSISGLIIGGCERVSCRLSQRGKVKGYGKFLAHYGRKDKPKRYIGKSFKNEIALNCAVSVKLERKLCVPMGDSGYLPSPAGHQRCGVVHE
ncbi:hypothetical protein RRG08_016831 [Elysia crispata]|uniref:Uncharacterized protein n=1 Tax=Elysia crispata TaxID=231223 RepID=A0AAE1DBQ3_9GAST|nr:hypothetical protein RRG08_016831 [Elysia crispata]